MKNSEEMIEVNGEDMPVSKVICLYILKCTHVMPGHGIDTELLCGNCLDKQTIIGVHIYEWHAFCDRDKCPFSKWAGLSQETAKGYGHKHYLNTGHSQVKIRYEINPAAYKILRRLQDLGLI